jgi:hypothetical protein
VHARLFHLPFLSRPAGGHHAIGYSACIGHETEAPRSSKKQTMGIFTEDEEKYRMYHM